MSFMTPLNRTMATEIGDIAGQHDVRLTLSIQDQEALWDAAAARLRGGGLDEEEIADCIGTRADISPADCLTTLILPIAVAGCTVTDIAVHEILPDLAQLLLAAAEATSHIGPRAFPVRPRFPS